MKSDKILTLPVVVLNVINENFRVYNNDVAEEVVHQFKKMEFPLPGELRHESLADYNYSNIDLHSCSHVIKDIRIVKNYNGGELSVIEADIKFLDRPIGKEAESMLKELSLSLRSIGKLGKGYYHIENGLFEGEFYGYEIEKDGFELITLDLIGKNSDSFRIWKQIM